MKFRVLLFLLTLVVRLLTVDPTPVHADEGEDWFETKVRPLLAAKCLECHGEQDAEAGLRLISRPLALEGGEHGAAIAPGKPDQSLLIRAVRYDGDTKMPPSGKLTDAQIADLVRWVELGAPWPAHLRPMATAKERRVTEADRAHWSFRPLRPKSPPSPVALPTSAPAAVWERSPVDAFVAATWRTGGVEPAADVDRRTLLRRVYFDLIGIPPTYDETVEFADDPAPTEVALNRIVDRLLASPRYGERWGRHWLDVARFADTKDGVLMYGDDRVRPYAYTYRDYVIRAFNEDLPFDRFVHEQLAADLIEPKVEPWRLAALGLLTLGRMYDNNVHDIIDDQIDVVTRGFLGLTVACARCHDHKYDPIPMADYYSLYGVFANSESPLEPPLIDDPSRFPGGAEFETQAGAKRADLRKFVDDQYELLSNTARERTTDYLLKVATTKPDPLETAIFFLSLSPEDLRPPITARWRRLVEQRSRAEDPVFAAWHACLQFPTDNADEFARRATQWLDEAQSKPQGVEPGQLNPLVLAALRSAKLDSRESLARAYGELLKKTYDEFKNQASAAGTASSPVVEPARRQLLDLISGPSSPAYFPKSQTRRYMSRGETDAFGGKVKDIDLMAVRSPAAPPRAMTLQDASLSVDPRVFTRGNPSQPGRTVPRQFLEIATSGSRSPFGGVSGRLDLARAITSPDNPLTARVIVNRIWMEHFGEPLVATPSDFGTRAASPAQVELLDWLAANLVRDGWSLKSLHRTLVTTRLYQVSADASGHSRTADPENRWLAHASRRRLDWEAMRDTLLSVSGRLEHRGAGRPIDVAADPAARVRTVYGLVDRQSLPGVFRAFDFATPDQSVERRPRTMVPQQALFALNSPFMIEQARSLMARAEMTNAVPVEQRVKTLYRLVLARDPDGDELAEGVEFVNGAGAGSKLSRWELLAQALLSCNELMYVD